MKKKVLAMFAIVAMFALAIAAYAYTNTSVTLADDKPSCCAKKDSCPMKSKGHDGKEGEHKMSCCKHGEDHAKGADHANCDCCGDSCPMKKGEAPKSTAVSTADDKKNCCDNCDCCKGKTEKTV
jgi:hypothetical protein